MIRRSKAALAVVALLSLPVSVPAATVSDPQGDFLATYTGPQNGDLDALSASAYFNGSSFRLSSVQNGMVGATSGSLYVWGINRGAGTPRLSFGSPSVGTGVLFDAVAVLFPNGTGRVAAFPAMGAPVITPLSSAAVTVDGTSISGLIPVGLLPSRGFAFEDYTFTMWVRKRENPALDGTNAELADFIPDASGFTASVPEPASWAMLIVGFGLSGAVLRRRPVLIAA